MHKEILNSEQTALLPSLQVFSKDFCLVGRTAIALYLGHRQSIDFDLFSNQQFTKQQIRSYLAKNNQKIKGVLVDNIDEFTVLVDNVKLTFLYYPFKIKYGKKFANTIRVPDLLTLAAMKAYTLGRRAKWKDYVDLYCIMNNKYKLEDIIKQAKKIFKNEFNARIFRNQLAYF